MRLLHTADWHLGRSFHGADLTGAQAAVLDHLIDVVRDERPDALVVAGDIFDRAYPPLAAVELYDDALARLAELRVPVVITSGNHDSAIRLGMHGRLTASAGVHVRARLDCIAKPVEIPSPDGQTGLLIYAIPYLDPPSTAVALEATESSHAGVLGAALRQIAADRSARPKIPAVVIAHGVVLGGRPVTVTEGAAHSPERSIDVGGVSAVSAELLESFDYAALGHLHRPQAIGERVRYSGAPLPFAFDEAGDAKSLAMVTLAQGTAPMVELLPTPQLRPIARIKGSLATLLADAEHAEHEGSWLEATLTDRLRPKQAMDQLRRRYPHVVKLEFHPEGRSTSDDATTNYGARIRGRSPQEVAERFVTDVRGGIVADDAERTLLTQALEAQAREDADE